MDSNRAKYLDQLIKDRREFEQKMGWLGGGTNMPEKYRIDELTARAEKDAESYFNNLSPKEKQKLWGRIEKGFYLWRDELDVDENEHYRTVAFRRFKKLLKKEG